MSSVLRVVLDANVLVSALLAPRGVPGEILRRCVEEDAFVLLLSDGILAELRRVLTYPKIRRRIHTSDEAIERWIAALDALSDSVEPHVKPRAVPHDPDDDEYIAVALDGRADLVVSGDAHLLDLVEHEGIPIVRPRSLLDRLTSHPDGT